MFSRIFPRITTSARALNNQAMRANGSAVSLEGFGDHVFRGAVAAPYLKKHGLAPDAINGAAWTTDGRADKVKCYILNFNISYSHTK